MKKKGRRGFALLLAVTVMVSLVACQEKEKKPAESSVPANGSEISGQESKQEETVTLQAFAVEGPYTKGDFNDLPLWKTAEEATGVKVVFESTPSASASEKLGLKFASNQLPDLFFKCALGNNDITRYAQEGSLIPLDQYLDKNAPNFSQYLNDDVSIEKNIRMADGHIYGFPYLVTAAPSRISAKYFMNEKWLEAQDLTMPKTTEELLEMLRKMKGYDFNQNGEADEIPLAVESYNHLALGLMGAFGLLTRGGAQQTWDIDPQTDELRFVKTTDQYKEYLEYVHTLYEEKLIDQECFTMDLTKLTAKAQQNILGLVITMNTNYLGDYKEDYTYLPAALIGPHGDQIYGARTIPVAGQNTFLTSVNNYPEETIKWVDYFYSDEGIEAYFMGVKGETYEIGEDGKPQFTDMVTNNPDGLNMEEVLGRYVCWSGGGNPSVADDLHFGNHLIPETTVKAAEALMASTPDEIWGTFVYSVEDTQRLSILQQDIDTYLSDMTAKFITGEVGFDQWDAYKQRIEQLGLEEYRQITQRALDTYNQQ